MASSKLHRNPPFRAEHLGSLLRPGELLKKRADLDGSKVEQKQLESLEDTAVKKIIYKPLELGFYAISDGEYRRQSTPLQSFLHIRANLRHQVFWGPFFPGMEGFTEIKNPEIDIFPPYMPDIAAFTESGHKPGGNVTCTEKLSISAARTLINGIISKLSYPRSGCTNARSQWPRRNGTTCATKKAWLIRRLSTQVTQSTLPTSQMPTRLSSRFSTTTVCATFR